MVDASIVIPAYNEEKYLEKTLKSLKNQKTKKDYEIIVVDNESTDRTKEIAEKYADIVLSEKEHIISKVRQTGAKKAKGEVILSASADSIYHKNWLETHLEKYEENVVGVVGKVKPLDGDKIDEIFSDFVLDPLARVLGKIGTHFSSADNLSIKKDVFKKIGGFNTKLITHEDTDLINRAKKYGKIRYSPDAISYVSMRRIKKWGKIKYVLFHGSNFINYHLFKKSHEKYEKVD